ncbi:MULTISPECIES: TetR/AcrR family transcriptional regulator [Microbacterium]|uniref:TetR/AcrR family transcriptional regulator n=1 Tax=Microbacterium TaxID=33882 RepID=UPI00278AED12|nr:MULTISPECIES: TetR/AcrR family transcriptional regulator [Microbacterium]MDQ1085448.1 AcrR family transcriptional regulator [Microbacterium sp. SORGH_AS_0344]MDQ1169246.1 AcrR family transcriptional regulator [Microbacterium proteolyticum]
MARWAPDTHERLREAALDLFVERGFDATTVADIVERAGVTRRTFFRHFADKREVFFDGDEIPRLATDMLAAAPADAPPFAIAWNGLQALAAERFEPRRAQMVTARRLIEAEPALRERDLQKQSDLRAAVTEGYRARGVERLRARVLAGVVVELLQTALEQWAADDTDATLASHLERARAEMAEILDGVVARR